MLLLCSRRSRSRARSCCGLVLAQQLLLLRCCVRLRLSLLAGRLLKGGICCAAGRRLRLVVARHLRRKLKGRCGMRHGEGGWTNRRLHFMCRTTCKIDGSCPRAHTQARQVSPWPG